MRGKSAEHQGIHINPWASVLFLLVLTVSVWLASSIANPWLAALAALSPLICGIGIVRSITPGLRPVAAVFYIFTFAWLGVAPVIQIATNTVAWSDTSALADPARVALTLCMNLVGTLAFFAGAEYARSREDRRQTERLQPISSARIRPWVLVGIIVSGLVLLPVAVQANGGLAALFTSRQELTGLRADMGTSITDIGGAAYALTRILPGSLAVAGALLTIYAMQIRWTSPIRVKGSHLLMLCLAGVSLILFCNPLAHSRFTTAAALGAVLLAWIRPRSTRWGILFATAMLAATLLIYPLANAFRADNFTAKTGTQAFTSADFDGFQQAINTVTYVQEIGHTWGSHILSGIGFFIPRSLWEDKAEPASYTIAENAGYIFTNLSLPLHSEFYLEFGWLGVIVGMGGLGFAAGRMDHAWLNGPGTKLAMITPYFAFAMLGIIRGPIGAQIPIWGTVVVLLMVGIARDKGDAPRNQQTVSAGGGHRAPSRLRSTRLENPGPLEQVAPRTLSV